MKVGLQLRKPQNWQDFETLCKKLWGEIWECPEIKKNGRAGQNQHGVDIFGIPKGEAQYYGIQCKGKDEYTHKQLTKEEIDREVKRAKNFHPPLKKLYFVTTANKDSETEKIVRMKDVENRKNGLFEIHLFSWEDIVELIDENKQTHDWYLKSQNFKFRKKVKVTFQGGSEQIEIIVPFLKKVFHYKQRPVRPVDSIIHDLLITDIAKISDLGLSVRDPLANPGFNESFCRFRLCFENVGDSVVENLKIFLNFEGDFESVHVCNKASNFFSSHENYNIYINNDTRSGIVKPWLAYNPLVQKDSFCSDVICLKPFHARSSEVVISWNLISTDYSDDGRLLLKLRTELKETEETIFVDHPAKEGKVEKIEDLITYKLK